MLRKQNSYFFDPRYFMKNENTFFTVILRRVRALFSKWLLFMRPGHDSNDVSISVS